MFRLINKPKTIQKDDNSKGNGSGRGESSSPLEQKVIVAVKEYEPTRLTAPLETSEGFVVPTKQIASSTILTIAALATVAAIFIDMAFFSVLIVKSIRNNGFFQKLKLKDC